MFRFSFCRYDRGNACWPLDGSTVPFLLRLRVGRNSVKTGILVIFKLYVTTIERSMILYQKKTAFKMTDPAKSVK